MIGEPKEIKIEAALNCIKDSETILNGEYYVVHSDYIVALEEEIEKLNQPNIIVKVGDAKEVREKIEQLQQELQRKDNIINELKESINNFDVFKEFTFPLMKRDEEQQVISSIDYEWRKSIKEPFLNKLKELKENK